MTVPRRLAPPRPLTLAGSVLPTVGPVRIYVCGITPYDVTHMGHAATYVWADVAERVLRWTGHRTVLARNITDVDEVLFAEARRRGERPDMLATLQRASFEATMASLRVRNPDHQPSAAQNVGAVVALAAALLAKDAAYVRDGSVYARSGRSVALAGLDVDAALALSHEYRDNPDDPAKEDPFDVVVWQSTAGRPDAEFSWPSPWGDGRPGWHAECAAMVLELFGAGVDLHCGGADLAYPHHACEAVLAESATGVAPFARAWMRAGTVGVSGAKMAKSTGNLVLVDDLLADVSPAVVRLLCVNRPWAASWQYSSAELQSAGATLDSLYAAAGRAGGSQSSVDVVTALLTDNLDVPGAVAHAVADGGAAARTVIEVLALS